MRENVTTDVAVIHEETCPHCNYGLGRGGGTTGKNNKWHDPFDSLDKAKSFARGTGRQVKKCGHCVAKR